MPIYMKYEGIDGHVTAAGHEKWIELDSAQIGVNRHITSAAGRGTHREASVPAVSEIVVTTMDQDAAHAAFLRDVCFGEGKKVKIDFCKTDKDRVEPYLQLELEDTLIRSYSIIGQCVASDARLMASLALNFTKITYNATSMGIRNETGKPDRAMWDLAQARGS